ncbi:hypothetical protein FBZ83_12371 [Azospirillum brasilense]|uniref:Uncharacterized protein n=1 Tax=Azospirillum brasilense TaxID=192 RepID=A0A560BSQ3_AZOBR|nr:hypothetical protein [Azospirillum brasilense]TWA75644.1 hypothetical protein FBZ83_12371 [Azospirillum brasilense]
MKVAKTNSFTATSASSSTFCELDALRRAVMALERVEAQGLGVRLSLARLCAAERRAHGELRWVSWRRRRSGKGGGGTPDLGSFLGVAVDAGIAHRGLSASSSKKFHLTVKRG